MKSVTANPPTVDGSMMLAPAVLLAQQQDLAQITQHAFQKLIAMIGILIVEPLHSFNIDCHE